MAPIPAVRQKRSNELSTSCQAVSRLGTSANGEVVVVLVMALLSFADSTPRAQRLKAGNASSPNSTSTGALPDAVVQRLTLKLWQIIFTNPSAAFRCTHEVV